MRLLTIGLGTLPGEAAATGVDFRARGRRADEAIDVLRLLWSGCEEGISFRGEFFCFDNLVQFPNLLPANGTKTPRCAAKISSIPPAHSRPARTSDAVTPAVQLRFWRCSSVAQQDSFAAHILALLTPARP